MGIGIDIVRLTTGDTIIHNATATATVKEIKEKIYLLEGTDPDEQHLLFQDRELIDDEKTIADYGVTSGCIVFMVLFS